MNIQLPNDYLEYKKGGKLKKSRLVKNAEKLTGNKRDMRKKFVKSSTKESDLKRPVSKKQTGGSVKSNLFAVYNMLDRPSSPIPTTPEFTKPQTLNDRRLNNLYNKPKQREEEEIKLNIPQEKPKAATVDAMESTDYSAYKGSSEFNKFYDAVEQKNPEARKYRRFLTQMAQQESGFNSNIQNQMGAPAYGYFQFMDFNIKSTGMSVEQFRNNPEAQINAAINLAKQFENGFTQQDLEIAKQKGYTKFGLLGGAWLGGVGGVRKYLLGQGNPSDKHWDKSGKNRGTDVASRIKAFNYD